MAIIQQGAINLISGALDVGQGATFEFNHGYLPANQNEQLIDVEWQIVSGFNYNIAYLPNNGLNPRCYIPFDRTSTFVLKCTAVFVDTVGGQGTDIWQSAQFIVGGIATLELEYDLVPAANLQCFSFGVLIKAFEVGGVVPTNISQYQIGGNAPVQVNPPAPTVLLDFPRNVLIQEPVTIDAENTSLGSGAILISENIPLMKTDITYTLTFSTITVEKHTGWAYDFGEGGGWETENSHVYSSAGQYTLSVRDAYGCVKTVQIVATELPVVDLDDFRSHFYVSKANSLRFFKVENKANCTVYGKDENSSGCDDLYTDIPYADTQMVRSCLTVNNQFRSGFDNHLIEVFDEEGTLVSTIFPTLVEENLRIVDRRHYEKIEDDIFTYIYFPDTFKIPYLFVPGLEVSIGGETHRIIDKKYIEDINRWTIVTEKFAAYNSTILETTYNRALYNTYEFSLNGFANGTYRVKITATRTTATNPADNITVVYSSLWFEVADSFEDTVDILYKNHKNNDIYWVGGFTGTITVGIQSRVAIGEIDLSVVGTDDDSYLDEAYGREQFRFLFEPLTLEMARKLMVALSQSEVLIDDTRYVFSNVSIASIGERTNDYTITAEGYKNMERIEFTNTFGCALGGGGGGSSTAGKQVRYDRIDDLVGNWSVLIPKGYSLHAIWISNSDTATGDANVLCGLTAGSDEIIDAIQGKVKFTDYKVADNTWKIFSRHTIFNPAADVRINFTVAGTGASASIIVQYLAIAD